jgi:tetratricopeptide (TPR) repeat protein
MVATQTLPLAAQPTATNPTAKPSKAAPAPASTEAAPAAPADTTTQQPPTAQPAPDAEPPTAASDPAGAKLALDEGQAAYKAGDYATAVAAFEKSLQLAPTSAGQYWLAMALDLQGRPGDAVAAFTKLFADPGHSELGEELLAPARQRLELLSKIPASVVLSVSPADAQVEVDSAVQSGASPHSVKLVAGKHAIRITAPGYEPLETELEVSAAQSLEQTIELRAAAPTPAPSGEPAPVAAATEITPAEPRSQVPAYVTLGVAGVSAALGTIFGLQALSAKQDFEDKDSPTAADADEVERNALIADMAWGIALTLGITGVVLLTSDEPSEDVAKLPTKKAGQLQVAPFVTYDGGGARARLTF